MVSGPMCSRYRRTQVPVYKEHSVAVIVPAYNEGRLIEATLRDIPDFVDSVIVIDDGSKDDTVEKARQVANGDGRVLVMVQEQNQGKGAAVVRGFEQVIAEGRDVAVLMDGDNQMPAEYVSSLLDPLIEDGLDATKGNRFIADPKALSSMPRYRMIGNVLLTMMTKLASGYWSIFDSQNGYWALRTTTIKRLELSRLAKRYDLENSLLINLNIIGGRLRDVPIPAVYGEEESKIRIWRVTPRIMATLLGGMIQRVFYRYILYNFHPVALFLLAGLPLLIWGILFGIFVVITSIGEPAATTGTVMLAVLPFLMGFQLLLAALVLDILSEPK
jgi:glycosyltransferase involved in cell wall biosynthesis